MCALHKGVLYIKRGEAYLRFELVVAVILEPSGAAAAEVVASDFVSMVDVGVVSVN